MEKNHAKHISFRRKESARKGKRSEEVFDYNLMSFLSQDEAISIYDELTSDFSFSVDQLIELAGLGCAVAIAKVYPIESLTKDGGTILVACGPGNTGGTGLICARHLKLFGYKPTIFYPRRPNKPFFLSLTSQCEKMDIPFLSYLPGEAQLITDSYNLIVDAVFGFRFSGTQIKHELDVLIERIIQSQVPIASLDVPSGWNVEKGDSEDVGLKPEVLISIMAPKLSAKYFHGKYHFLAGRFVPFDLAKKYDLRIPPYFGTECIQDLPIEGDSNKEKEKEKEKENGE